MNTIRPEFLTQAINYQTYHQFMAQLVTHTATEDYSEAMINYTRMNIIRMERLDKTTRLLKASIDKMESIQQKLYWLILTEPWCGDAAQVLPVTQKLAELRPNIETGFLMRDKHPKIMDAFLTAGTRSIPKIIILAPEQNYKVLGSWGPRPFVAQGMMMRGLEELRSMEEGKERELFKRDLYTKLQKWYARDKTTSIQEEFTSFLLDSLNDA